MPDDVKTRQKYNVGGLLLDRPFKIRRLGHFGFDNVNMAEGVKFYTELLGFRVSDVLDFGRLNKDGFPGLGETRGFFMRHGTDHHSFVLFPRRVRQAMNRHPGQNPEVTTNQITFQVGNLREVVEGHNWLVANGVGMERAGRDLLGSNYHTYLYDPDDHIVELYYGVQQIGWDQLSKPVFTTYKRWPVVAELPQPAEYDEILTEEHTEGGAPLNSGYRGTDDLPPKYEVGGVLLPRPFKTVRIGPVRLFVKNMEASLAYYVGKMGFIVSEEVTYKGHRCVFLRVNTEHHSLALYPHALRAELGLSPHSSCMSFGLQMGSYQQLRDALSWLGEKGAKPFELPSELRPGMDQTFYVKDPDGHALELYHYMEQVGWDGRVRPASARRTIKMGDWPEALEAPSDAYMGEPFLGPLA
jgi:catechol 2,3-dioxygenase-like lactoylglutathione lyase family enzyme